MRKFILAFIVSVPGCAWAQWQPTNSSSTDNGNIYHLNGNVGIGTSTINGNLQIGSGTGNSLVNLGGYAYLGSIRSSGDYFAGTNVLAQYGSSTENWKLRVAATSTLGFSALHMGSNGDINFFTRAGSVNINDPIDVTQSTYNAMKITGNGRVGIGTISPGAQFTVALPGYTGTPANTSLTFISQSTNPAGTDLKPALELSNNGGNGYGLVSVAANNYMSGNLGLGASVPQGTLHINNIRPVIVKNNGGNGVYGSEIGFNAVLNTSVSPNQFRKLGGTSQVGGANIAVDYHGNMLFQMADAPSEAENIINYSPQVTFLNNGNVGIGTTSPYYKFHVSAADASVQQRFERTGSSTGVTDAGVDNQGFKFFVGGYSSPSLKVLFGSNGNVGIGTFNPDSPLTVNGSVHAKEVRVDLNVPGPDYVFEKDYHLTSLEDIKTYIDQNKHLPEVPSAKEMEKNGVQLGEMNMLLLKKIEELTLYVIELKKENEEIKKENRSVLNEMQNLKFKNKLE
jgi:hypothetical protein